MQLRKRIKSIYEAENRIDPDYDPDLEKMYKLDDIFMDIKNKFDGKKYTIISENLFVEVNIKPYVYEFELYFDLIKNSLSMWISSFKINKDLAEDFFNKNFGDLLNEAGLKIKYTDIANNILTIACDLL